jgi:hypothetical protein
MDKETKVNNLILNGGFVESDRTFLMSLDDAGLTRLESYATSQVEAVQQAVIANQQQTDNEEEEAAPKVFDTIEAFISSGPAQFQEPLKLGLAAFNERRAAAIKTITANKDNTLTTNELEASSLKTLEALAKFATKKAVTTNEQAPDYSGQAPVAGAEGQEMTHNEAPLPTPNMSDLFKKK